MATVTTSAKKKPTVLQVDSSVNVIESLIFSRAQNYGNAYRQRFFGELIRIAQRQIWDNFEAVRDGRRVVFNPDGHVEITFPLRLLLSGEGDKNYAKAKAAILDFSNWKLEYDDGDLYMITNVLSVAKFVRSSSTFGVELRREVWDMLLDFSKGYLEYNIDVLSRIENPFARQMYKCLKNLKGPLTYGFDTFRKVFGYEDKYVGRDRDLVGKVVAPAKAELDRVSDWTFEYRVLSGERVGSGRGRPRAVGLEFVSVNRLGMASEDVIRKRVHPAELVGSGPYSVLTSKLDFRFSEVKANLKLFVEASSRMGEEAFADWLSGLVPAASRAERSIQGYVVNSTRQMLRNKFGVVFEDRLSGGFESYPSFHLEDASGAAPQQGRPAAGGDSPAQQERSVLPAPAVPGRSRGGEASSVGELMGSLFADL